MNSTRVSRMKDTKGSVCQVCASVHHFADKCPFLYTRCKIPNCAGIRMLMESHTETNYGRKFLKCQYLSCTGIQWLDEAIEESKGFVGTSSTSMTFPIQGCFLCGLCGHWKKDCPWIATQCTKCPGIVSLKVSSKGDSVGKTYLKCDTCGHFEWFNPKEKNIGSSSKSVKMTFEGSLDDFCEMFNKKLSN